MFYPILSDIISVMSFCFIPFNTFAFAPIYFLVSWCEINYIVYNWCLFS